MSVLRVTRLNSVPAGYSAIMALQEALFQDRKLGLIPDTMLLLQHSPVYTMGKRGREADFRSGLENIIASGAEIAKAPRGGETTYHGPGQLVAYPIVNLRELKLGPRAYVESLEDIMISTAKQYGIAAQGRIKCRTGVWVDDRKLGAVGVALSSGFTRHGLALNVNTDLSAFNRIIPCGDGARQATSIAAELGGTGPCLEEAAEVLARASGLHLNADRIEWISDVNELIRHIDLSNSM